MKAYVLVDALGSVDVLLGNGDELTPAEVKDLRAWIQKLGGKLLERPVEPVAELEGYVVMMEEEAREP